MRKPLITTPFNSCIGPGGDGFGGGCLQGLGLHLWRELKREPPKYCERTTSVIIYESGRVGMRFAAELSCERCQSGVSTPISFKENADSKSAVHTLQVSVSGAAE